MTRINELIDVSSHPLYVQRQVKTKLYIVVTSDRGLAGAYNSATIKRFTAELKQDQKDGVVSQAITVGKQGATFASRIETLEIIGAYTDFPDNPSANDLQPIITTATQRFTDLEVDSVQVLYTDFKSSIVQEVTLQTLLPAVFVPNDFDREDLSQAVFEPSPQEVLETITPRLIEVQLLQALLESVASEHSMRMMAMKSASDNASDLIDDLTLAFNSARQAAITQELAEIVGGAEAIA